MPNVMIQILDLKERHKNEITRLENRKFQLEQRRRDGGGHLPPDLEKELKQIGQKLLLDPADPLYIGLRKVLGDIVSVPRNHPRNAEFDVDNATDQFVDPEVERLVAVYGLLGRDGLARVDFGSGRFAAAVTGALGEYSKERERFKRVLPILIETSKRSGQLRIRADEWASVVRVLKEQGVAADDKDLELVAVRTLGALVGGDDDAPRSSIDIDLPDLEQGTDVQIVAKNVLDLQPIYFSAMLEDAQLFAVADKLVELFQNGMLPIGRGGAGDLLHGYWKKGVDRLSEVERRNLYARTLGFPGGDPSQANPNREFSDLWLRFVSAVSSFARQVTVDNLLRARVPGAVSGEQVRKSGRDLAANLSLHGYGVAHYAAADLQSQIKDVIALLSNEEIRSAYGARDMWQVVEQVSAFELGGARSSSRYRTLATSGAVIIAWLAKKAEHLSGSYQPSPIEMDEVRRPTSRAQGTKATADPTDRDLVDACEQWLAVTGTPEQRVEEFSQPAEPPNLTSRPIQIPQMARDALASAGIQASYGGNGNGRPGNRFTGYR